MMKKRIRIIAALTAVVLLLSMTACGSDETGGDSNEASKLSFKSTASYEELKALDGTTVSINGYMATSSPVDGSFMFLMNMPFQNCPFCKPNTSQLSNTMEVYPREGAAFDYTTQAIQVIGTLVVAPSVDEPFKDKYDYEFNFKIVDADYYILSSEDLSEEFALFQKLSQTDIINEVYNMQNYLNFVCKWNTYKVDSYQNEYGETMPGYFLWPSDAERFLKTDGAQYNYGYQPDYFDNLIVSVEAVDPNAFADLVQNIRDAQTLAEKAIAKLDNGEYTFENRYVEEFDTTDNVYTINDGEALAQECDDIYYAFVDWLASWEM